MQAHRPILKEGCDEASAKAAVPISTLDSGEMVNWISESKALAAPIEADIKDAKRRVTAAKGPKNERLLSSLKGKMMPVMHLTRGFHSANAILTFCVRTPFFHLKLACKLYM